MRGMNSISLTKANLLLNGFRLPKQGQYDKMSEMETYTETRWGYWEEIRNEPEFGYRVKILVLYPNKEISLQYHDYRSEHWAIVQGFGEFTLGDTIMSVQRDDSVNIPLGVVHKVKNVGHNNLIIVETQLGDCRENDITRLEEIEGITDESAGKTKKD